MSYKWLSPILLALITLTGCSWFGDEEEDARDPVPLTKFKEEIKLDKLWELRVGDASAGKGTRLVPLVRGSRVFAASVDGRIVAVQSGNGKVIWETSVRDLYGVEDGFFGGSDLEVISGGVGGSDDLLFVGTTKGDLIALNQSDGSQAWLSKATSEILAAPQAGRDVVVAQTIDGKIIAYDLLDGERRWVYSASLPSLTLRGTSTPLVVDDYVIAGFANGRVVVLTLDQGVPRMDQRVANAQGKSDLERLIDIDGQIVATRDSLYAVSYQGNLVAIDLSSTRLRWANEASSWSGLAEGFGNIYVAHDDGRITALDQANSRPVWETESLKYRQLSTPVAVSSYLAVGDLEGQLHLLAQSDGRFVGRQKIDGEPIRAAVVADGNVIYYMGVSGRLSAYALK